MALQIKGNMEVGRHAEAGSKNLARSVNDTAFDGTGNASIDTFRIDYFNKILSVLPLSHFEPGNITSSGYTVQFNDETDVLLSGKVFTLPQTNINLTTIKPNPANTTYYVYITLEQGLAKYLISEDVISESGSSAYNIFWIGILFTNITTIGGININARKRLDVFSPAYNSAGSSFPVSNGLPTQNGTINW
jgi:hypothetical protein